jgi:hypothetical protein
VALFEVECCFSRAIIFQCLADELQTRLFVRRDFTQAAKNHVTGNGEKERFIRLIGVSVSRNFKIISKPNITSFGFGTPAISTYLLTL